MQQGNDIWDVIVIGGGIAGMIVATICLDRGLKSLVIEKGKDFGGLSNSRISSGYFNFAHHDMTDPPDVLKSSLVELANGEIDPHLAEALSRNAGSAWRWLISNDLKVTRENANAQFVVVPIGYNIRTKIQHSRGTEMMMRKFYENFVSKNGSISFASTAYKISQNAQGWKVFVSQEDAAGDYRESSTLDFICRALCFCDGGFQANPEFVDRYIGSKASKCLLRSMPSQTGDGLKMAIEAGGILQGAGRFYGHMQSIDAFDSEKDLWPYPHVDDASVHALLIHRDGRILKDEYEDGIIQANILARTRDPTHWFLVMSENDWKRYGSSGQYGPAPGHPKAHPDLEQLGGTVYRTSSLDEISIKTGINEELLRKAYDEYLQTRSEIEKSPNRYVAVPVVPGITFTLGGITINERCQVIEKNKKPIPGLYAAGSTCGGPHGGPNGRFAGGLAIAATTAYIAGNNILQDTLK